MSLVYVRGLSIVNFVNNMYSTEQKSIKVRSIVMCSHLTVRMFIEQPCFCLGDKLNVLLPIFV